VPKNDHEIPMISSARPQREYYYRSPIGSRLFILALGDLANNLCAATGYNHVRLARRLGGQFFDFSSRSAISCNRFSNLLIFSICCTI